MSKEDGLESLCLTDSLHGECDCMESRPRLVQDGHVSCALTGGALRVQDLTVVGLEAVVMDHHR